MHSAARAVVRKALTGLSGRGAGRGVSAVRSGELYGGEEVSAGAGELAAGETV